MPFISRSGTSRILLASAILAGLVGLTQAQKDYSELDVPFVPTPPQVVARMLDLAKVTKDDFVMDLGSGDGRIAIAAAKRGARAFGVDIDPYRVNEARENAKKEGVADRATFEVRNLFDTKIGEANVLTMYLLQTVNLQLRPRILSELKPGSRVVSHAFSMDEWEADQKDIVDGRSVYYWMVPAKADGNWQVEISGHRVPLSIKQAFQVISGTTTVNGRAVPLTGRLQGEQIEFKADLGDGPADYVGKVSGGSITGQNWRATRS
jgi:precorrin-6B methylase 2